LADLAIAIELSDLSSLIAEIRNGVVSGQNEAAEPAMGVVSAWLRLGNIGLASKTALPHNVTMAEVHPSTFKIEADPLREMRYRWTVCEGNQIHLRSPNSYATRRDAEIEAAQALSNRVAHWRKRE
jgi:hypothetical protein